MKTIALKEHTFELLKSLKERERKRSFEAVIVELVKEKENIPDSMFGAFKGKAKRFTKKERKEMWKDDKRERYL
jgi:predicted CopG family antitoxin